MKPTHYAAFIAWEAGRKHSSILEILRRFFRGMRG